jgi:hypothetical protein
MVNWLHLAGISPGGMNSSLGFAFSAKAAGVGANGWNAHNFTKFQNIVNKDPSIGRRFDLDYEIWMRTKPLTPWMVELFLKQMERNSITLGIHKNKDNRRVATPLWQFKRWYGQLPYWANGTLRGAVTKSVDQQIKEELDHLFGMGPKPEAAGRDTIDTDYFDPYDKNNSDMEYTRDMWDNSGIPAGAKFIPSSDGFSNWAIFNPKLVCGATSNACLGAIREYGDLSHNMPPRPWLRPAVEKNMDVIRQLWSDCIKSTFRDVLEVGTFGPWIQVGGKRPRFYNFGKNVNLFMGWDKREPYAPGGFDKKFYKTKSAQQEAIFENMFREMLQQHNKLLGYLKQITQDELAKSYSEDDLSPFTKDYKIAGGRTASGATMNSLSKTDLESGVFTGQLYDAIDAKWESAPKILQR